MSDAVFEDRGRVMDTTHITDLDPDTLALLQAEGPELARLATEFVDAVRADDTVAMARITEETRARRRVLSPPADVKRGDDGAYRVDLYEDNAGALLLVHPGPGGRAYEASDSEEGEFEGAAVAILNGDTMDWTPQPVPAAWLNLTSSSWRLIASYDELTGEVTVERDPASGDILAGTNGRRYLAREWLARLEAGDG